MNAFRIGTRFNNKNRGKGSQKPAADIQKGKKKKKKEKLRRVDVLREVHGKDNRRIFF